MTALAKDRKSDKMAPEDFVLPGLLNLPVEAATTIFGGSMVAINAAGNAVPASANTALKVVGRCEKQVVNTVAAGYGAAGALRVEVRQGCFYQNNGTGGSAIAAANLFAPCYASDDNTVSLTDGAGQFPFAGLVYDVRSDGQIAVMLGKLCGAQLDDLDLDTREEFKCRAVLTAALAAYTSVAGVITANANGAFGTGSDGVTLVAGDQVFLPEGLAAALKDAGPYVVTSLGGASAKFVLTRPDWYAFGSTIQPGQIIEIGGEGTLFAGATWKTFAAAGQIVDTNTPLWTVKEVLQSVVLVAGTATLTNVPIKSTTKSAVIITRTVANTSTLTTGGYYATNGGANGITAGNLGTASIIIQACVAAGTINVADISTVNVLIKNW